MSDTLVADAVLVSGEHVRAALASTNKPQTVTWITRQLPKPLRKATIEIEAAIQGEVAAGRLWEHPPQRGQRRYFTRSLDALATAELERKLSAAKGGLLPESGVLTALKKFVGVDRGRQLLQQLLDQHQLYRHPAVTGKTIRYASRPIDPRDYLAAPVAKLDQDLQKLSQKLGLPATDLKAALMALILPESTAASAAAVTDDEVLQALRDINPRVDTGDVVSLPELRSRLAFRFDTKQNFDRCLLGLAGRWRITLHFYNHAQAMSADERQKYVEDEQGRCYNVVSLRRNV
ncbi:MAG: hypothetical protein ACK5Q5_07910 [Planctomycetaceae bacterium]